jgi:hypothetical protein
MYIDDLCASLLIEMRNVDVEKFLVRNLIKNLKQIQTIRDVMEIQTDG